MLDDTPLGVARSEVHKTLKLCDICTSKLAISFIDEEPSAFAGKLRKNAWYFFSVLTLILLLASEFAFVIGSSSVAQFVASLHIVGYGCTGLCKCVVLWLNKPLFRKVVNQLVELWPVSIDDEEIAELKRNSVSTLRFVQICYMWWTLGGSALYTVPKLLKCLYLICIGDPDANQVFVWESVYPFDKTAPGVHKLVLLFEAYSGFVSVLAMLGLDLMFTSMASHISMLLRILQIRIRGLCQTDGPREQTNVDCYDELRSYIKIHQRLISFCTDLEEVFSFVNLVNVLLSSINICCVVFNIVLLEPWTEMSSKFFLGAILTQVGIICWYADDIFRASIGVADAVYASGWYKSNIRCRRAILLLLQRSQKPLYFTALKFRSITLATYRSILTTSYSYFTLLYTMYDSN